MRAGNRDPYFRLAREMVHRLGHKKCSLILSKFYPALQARGSLPCLECALAKTDTKFLLEHCPCS